MPQTIFHPIDPDKTGDYKCPGQFCLGAPYSCHYDFGKKETNTKEYRKRYEEWNKLQDIIKKLEVERINKFIRETNIFRNFSK